MNTLSVVGSGTCCAGDDEVLRRPRPRDLLAVLSLEIKIFIKLIYLIYYTFNLKNQLHAVSRTQQGSQREPSVKTLHSPLSADFWRRCVWSGRTQRRA